MKKAIALVASLGIIAMAASCQRGGLAPGAAPLDEGAVAEPTVAPQEQAPGGPSLSEGQETGSQSKQVDEAKICSLGHRILALDPKMLVAGDGATASAVFKLIDKDSLKQEGEDGSDVDPAVIARIASDVHEFAIGSLPDAQTTTDGDDVVIALISFRDIDPATVQSDIDYLVTSIDDPELEVVEIDLKSWRWDVAGTAAFTDVVYSIGKKGVYDRIMEQIQGCTQSMLDALCVLGDKPGGIYAIMNTLPSDDKFIQMLGGSQLKLGAKLTVSDDEVQAYGWLVRGACAESNVLASVLPMMKREFLDVLIQYLRERGTDDVEEALTDEQAPATEQPVTEPAKEIK